MESYLGVQPRREVVRRKYNDFLDALNRRERALDKALSIGSWGGLAVTGAGAIAESPEIMFAGLGVAFLSNLFHRKAMNQAAKRQGFQKPLFQF